MENRYYLGIDLDDYNAIVSFFQLNMREPETVSTVTGSEVYQIPLVLAKKKGLGQWFYGEHAKKLALQQGETEVEHILNHALSQEAIFVEEEKYPAEDLLALFLKKLIYMAGSLGNPAVPDKIVIVLEKLSREATRLFSYISEKLGLSPEQITLIDRKESFYYFAFSQKKELWLHDVCLFDARQGDISCVRAECNTRTVPQLVTMFEEVRRMDANCPDESFLKILQEELRGHIVSSVYLIGDDFDGDWMKQSLAFMCKGRRGFMGKNLYAKGACYAAVRKEDTGERTDTWPFIYMGDNEMKVNVSLKVHNLGKEEFYTLINAGDNWYETVGECEVLLDGEPEIDFWLQLPRSREAKLEKLELADLPKRPRKATRLRILAKPLSDQKVQIVIKDMGFGEIFKSSDKSWEYVMSL